MAVAEYEKPALSLQDLEPEAKSYRLSTIAKVLKQSITGYVQDVRETNALSSITIAPCLPHLR
jgi:hypothetical protein